MKNKMVLHDTVAIVVEKEGKFLLIKRANKPNRNYWAVPGGHVDKNETPYNAAVREVREEVGEVEISKKPFYIFVHDVDIGHKHKCHTFLGKAIGRIRAGGDAKKFGFFTLTQMKRMNLTHYTIKILNEFFK
ncbi:MAG: NUDIX domain-containing protein [Candidatus Aenigmarchaeota archaeon]|nr:NUDIX domain-containing protein [Candidatus Aenigmarchaeota archaeon]